MAAIDLSGLEQKQADGSASVDATLANNLITLPGWANELHLYLDNATAGTFTLTNPAAAGRPLPAQTWTRVWVAQKANPDQNPYVWAASGGGSVTLHYLVY